MGDVARAVSAWVLHSDIHFERGDVRKAVEMLGEELLCVESDETNAARGARHTQRN